MRSLSHLKTRGENQFHPHPHYGGFVLIGVILLFVFVLLFAVETVQ